MSTTIIYLGFNNFLKFKRGVENVILNQIAFSKANFKLYICFDTTSKVFRYNNVICICIKNDLFRFIVLNWLILKIQFKYKRKIYIHSHNYLMSFLLLKRTNFFTVHDGIYYSFKQLGKNICSLICAYIIEKVVYIRSRHLHFISNFAKDQSLYFDSTKSYSIIYNTFVPQKFYDIPDFPFVFSKKISYNVLIVRSIEDRANIELIIDLAEYLVKIGNFNYSFTIVGKGPLLDTFQNKILEKKLCNIKFEGYIPDNELEEEYLQADIILLPAKYGEGFGLPLIEGYYYNKPVIASKVCAIPEIIYNSDFLFDNNLESIYTTLTNTFLNSKNCQFRKYFDEKFAAMVIAKEYTNFYFLQTNAK